MELYSRVADPPVYAEVLLFENRERAERFYDAESYRLGVVGGVQKLYLGFHDAWLGYPRVGFVVGEIERLGEALAAPIILHEASHTVLHGSIIYYTLPHHLLGLISPLRFDRELGILILNSIFTGVKDFEVSELMLKLGYRSHAEAYASFVLKTSREDVEEWREAEGSPSLELLHITRRLKDVLAAAPIPTLRELMKREARYLGRKGGQFVWSYLEHVSRLSGDTFEKLETAIKVYQELATRYLNTPGPSSSDL